MANYIKAGYQDFLEYDPAAFEIKYGDYTFNGNYFGIEQQKVTIDPNEIKSEADLKKLLGFEDKLNRSTTLFGDVDRSSKLFGNLNNPQSQSPIFGNQKQYRNLSYGESYYDEQFTKGVFDAIKSGKPMKGYMPINQVQRVKGDGSNITPIEGTVQPVTTGYGSMRQNDDGTYDLYISPTLDTGEAFTQKVHDATWDIYNNAKNGRGKTPKTSLLA